MDWFTNIFSPITERTNINDTLATFNNYWYGRAQLSTQLQPMYNFTGGSTYNNGWNFFQNNNFNGSIFGFEPTRTNTGNCFNYSIYPGSMQYNFGGGTKVNGSRRVGNTRASASTASTPAVNNTSNDRAAAFSKKIATNAEKYLGYNEADGSFRRFSNDPEWCADFVTYVVKETYRNEGKAAPAGFGSWRCENLKQWAINHNKFLFTAGKTNQQDIIKNKVKPGDIVIMRENGASHTGIVRYIDKETGNYQTIEGNVTARNNDSVVKVNHRYNDPEVSGFIQLV